jgi:hypothetical protein
MTNEEYYELISTFKSDFTPSGATCRKYNTGPVRNCEKCKCFSPAAISCGLYISDPKSLLPEFYEKVLLLTPEKLL